MKTLRVIAAIAMLGALALALFSLAVLPFLLGMPKLLLAGYLLLSLGTPFLLLPVLAKPGTLTRRFVILLVIFGFGWVVVGVFPLLMRMVGFEIHPEFYPAFLFQGAATILVGLMLLKQEKEFS